MKKVGKMKVQTELNMPDDRRFLNYWDPFGGDVICEVRDDKLYLQERDEDGNETEREITITEYFDLVKKSVRQWM